MSKWRVVKCKAIGHGPSVCPSPWLAVAPGDMKFHEFSSWRSAMRFVRRQLRGDDE